MTRGKSADIHPADAPARDLRLKTVDGVTLAATYWSGKKQGSGAILLLHGVDASRSAMEANAAWLASLGYAVLTIDFRGHGQSTMTGRSFGFHEAKDAQAAFDWLKRRQRGAPVAVIGISMGGAASLIGGRGPLPADALVLQAVYPDIRSAIRDRIAARLTTGPASLLEPLLSFQSVPRFGVWPSDISPIRAIKRFRGAVLVIGGKEDRYTPPDETRALFEAAPGRKSLWLVPRADHVATSSLRDAYYRTRLKGFLEATIGLP
jgi:alpha-beta hydrolase superfamily lysophospholipase